MARRALMLREGRAPVWDRLLAMLFLVALLHGMVILGLTFNARAGDKGAAPGLEVLLVSDELPEADQNPTATYLAQRTQIGSGNTREAVAPRNRASSAPQLQHDGTPAGDSLARNSEQSGSAEERVLTSSAWRTTVRYLADAGVGAAPSHDKPLLMDTPATAPPGPADEDAVALRGPRRDELSVAADTRIAIVAPYLTGWRAKVERIGTVKYPYPAAAAAKASGRNANPVVDISIGSDGRLQQAVITRSSGSPELDNAALQILKLASPFDPFPPELAAQYRVLRVSYELQFSGGSVGAGTVTTVP